MLIATNDARWSQDQRIKFYLDGLCAVDIESGAELYASDGQRKSGRGTRYTVRLPSGETRMGFLNTDNPRPIPVKRKAFTVTAQSDRLAIEQANKALARFLSKKPAWSVEDWNWTFPKPA